MNQPGLQAPPVISRLNSAAEKKENEFYADSRCSSCPPKVDAVSVTVDHDAPTSQTSHHTAGSCL